MTSAAGDKGVVSAAAYLDSTKALASVRFRLSQDGLDDLQLTMDSAVACLNPFEIRLPIVPEPPRVVR